jgi:hypothetical protein
MGGSSIFTTVPSVQYYNLISELQNILKINFPIAKCVNSSRPAIFSDISEGHLTAFITRLQEMKHRTPKPEIIFVVFIYI